MMWSVRAGRWSVATALAAMSISMLACGSTGRGLPLASAASSTQQHDAGIGGEVRIGPTCPVQRPGKVCERPYPATITIRREPSNMLVARVRSTATGNSRIALAQGRYLLLPQNGHPYPRSWSQMVTVHRHRYTPVAISYDSGSR